MANTPNSGFPMLAGMHFTVKNIKLRKGNLYLTENRLRKNEIWCVVDNYNDTCHTCAKGFLDLSFNLAVTNKISDFHKITPNFTYSQKNIIFQS